MRKDMNNIGIRHDRPMTTFEIEMAAMNMREIERSNEYHSTPTTNPIIKFMDKVMYCFMGIVALAVIYAILFM